MNAPTHPLHFIKPREASGGNPPVVAITPEITALLEKDAVVAIGVSGGKDSQACAIAVAHYLDQVGHTGPRLLVHSDLGRVEWKESLPVCERLAEHLNMELLVVRRQAGDMMDRWQQRWKNNVARYVDLSCVKLILPWSTPSMRFCTSELKTAVITSALKKRYPGQNIVNVCGIRREESPNRAKAPVSKVEPKLARKGNVGHNWNAIIEWTLPQVLQSIADAGLALHPGYTVHKASRISCAYCIMSSEADLLASAGCVDNQDVYVEMVELEAESAFAFQGNRWLGDVAPHLLDVDLRYRLAAAKENAVLRQRIESAIPEHLLYHKGWPTALPTLDEAKLLATVRRHIGTLFAIPVAYTTGDEIIQRYSNLLDKNSPLVTNCADQEPDFLDQRHGEEAVITL